ncbi:MAG: hypothetical protein HQK72_14965 [Desulfamplus sp.]|nr:hypothetical protein [Desulfamplus sp.]
MSPVPVEIEEINPGTLTLKEHYTDYEYKREGTVDLYMAAEPSGEGVKC